MAAKLPFDEVNRTALGDLSRVLDWAGVHWKQHGHEIQMINPQRADKGYGSFSVNANTGAWADFSCGDKGGDVVSLVAYLRGMPQGETCKELAKLLGISSGVASPATEKQQLPAPVSAPAGEQPLLPIAADMLGLMPKSKAKHPGKVVQVWRYNDADGLPLVFVARLEPGGNGRSKDYLPLSVWVDQATGKRVWKWKGLPAPRPLYGLDRLALRPDAGVVICEGEKAADAAAKLLPDHVAICWMNGAEAVSKADFSPLAGRDCLIWPDHDQPGEQAASAVAVELKKVGARSVAVIDPASFERFAPAGDASTPALVGDGAWGKGDDAADALPRGWTPEHLAMLLAQDGTVQIVQAATAAGVDTGSRAPSATQQAPKRPKADSQGGPFRVTDGGLWFQTADMDDAMWVCDSLEIVASTRDKSGENWGVLVRFADQDRTQKEWNIPAEMLATSEGAEVVKGLMSRGLRMGSGPKARQRLLEYLGRYTGTARATMVPRLGWHGDAFLLPDGQVGSSQEQLVFQASNKQREVMQVAGTLQEWQQQVGQYCVGNSRLAFAVSVAFAGPLLDIIGAESGGFHFYGDSSQGKTTLLQVAASVFGTSGYMQTWRATDNAIEALAAAYSDCLLPLDEIHQCDPRIVGETIYMLGNGRGKNRANDRGGSRGSVAEWRLLFLSSGEKTLAAHLAEARKEMKAGMEIRMLAIKADAGESLGLFNHLHGLGSGKTLADQLKGAVAQYHGTPARAFIEKLVSERGNVASLIRDGIVRFCNDALPAAAHGQVHRAASRFALVAMAGELASMWGVTGWGNGEAWKAAHVCFADWLAARGTVGNREDEEILSKLRLFFEQHGEDRFTRLSDESILHDETGGGPMPDDHAPKTMNRCGYRRRDKSSGVTEYFVFPESFRKEICAGFDYQHACKLLAAAGALDVTKGAGFMYQTRATPEARAKNGRVKVYCVTSRLLDIDSAEDESGAAYG
ncbi:DNA primase [Aquitalea magnusonii]|uniref:DNA primase n=1 Tax=Aquitalea magnusonii TaxID=332411 RepID=A0A3G9GIG3_9NEIS|nr:DUF927 domain-containing protein [Aquitalea magnusonii]BBF87688.1 DNA primase [Aquitalea magnusonii]